ncbi:hypothetical protein FHT00_000221 [Sphingomonas insulae]|uniref:Rap1a immunity protein domain-containing protein n=1 Tax=Sphingomonas insulae TaxID=424800 RepID=A0ABN1HU92_9SPHN|nr:Rap1a/Tai family immunity protein [Sphingomonas insulae]NIJ28293.1 hypothetical protein [Sphingomonas insulae]
MLLMLALLVTVERPVVVSSLTTAQLVEQCRGKDDDPLPSFCSGYIIGVFDTLSQTQQICPAPSHASTNDMVATVRKYLRKRGEKATAAPAFVVRDALKSAFPCARSPRKRK